MASVRNQHQNQLLAEIQSAIAFDQPKLIAEANGNEVIVKGTFLVIPTTGEHTGHGAIAEYAVEIVFQHSYPKVEPYVKEAGGTIPHDADHHINPDGSCCILIWDVWASTSEDTSVQAYFDGPLKNFFLGQHEKHKTGKWPFGEWKHGKEGLIDAYAELLGCACKESKISYLLRILRKDWPRGHWDCPCGSGQIIRKCCRAELAGLSKKVSPKSAKRMLACLRVYDR